MANQLKILNTTIAYVDKLEEVTSYNAQLLFNITIRINNKMATGLKRGDGWIFSYTKFIYYHYYGHLTRHKLYYRTPHFC